MIATMSGEIDQTQESISTCKFAQRVAKIKNIVSLNEEQDPFLVIRRLKARVRDLEAELSMLKGETQEGFSLTEEELQDLKNRINCYINSIDNPPILDLGEFNYTRIRKGFEIMRDIILNGNNSNNNNNSKESNPELLEKINELEQQILQRDTEISVLVEMVKKNQRIANTPNTSMRQESKSSYTPSPKPIYNGKVPGYYGPGGDVVDSSYLKDKDSAYKVFKTMYPNIKAMEQNKLKLKEKFEEAKHLGEKVNNSRKSIEIIKKTIEQLRIEKSMSGLLNDSKEPEDDDESKAMEELEANKSIYLNGFAELKQMKLEIEHIKHLVENEEKECKINFEKWFIALDKYYNSTKQIKPKTIEKTQIQPIKQNVDNDIAAFYQASKELLNRLK